VTSEDATAVIDITKGLSRLTLDIIGLGSLPSFFSNISNKYLTV
jgi:hypothetical protein